MINIIAALKDRKVQYRTRFTGQIYRWDDGLVTCVSSVKTKLGVVAGDGWLPKCSALSLSCKIKSTTGSSQVQDTE